MFICFGSIDTHKLSGSSVSGKIVAQASYCPDLACSGMPAEQFIGSYQTTVSAYAKNFVKIILSPPIYAPSGSENFNAVLSVFGHNSTIATVNVTANGTKTAGDPISVNMLHYAASCAKQLQVSYGGITANQTLPISPAPFSGSSYSLSDNGKSAAVMLLNKTSSTSISVSGNQNQACFFAETQQKVTPAVSGNQQRHALQRQHCYHQHVWESE